MKNLVCLVTAQHVPNLLTVRAVNPDHLVLVETPGMRIRNGATRFLNALSIGGTDYASRHEIVEVREENSVDATFRALQTSFSRNPNDEWIINVTGGTKPMSIGAYGFAKSKGLKALYIVEKDQHRAIDLSGGEPVVLNHLVSTAEFLAGYGFDLLNPSDLARHDERARRWLGLAALLTENYEDASLRKCLGALQDLKDMKIKKSKKAWERGGLTLAGKDNIILNNENIRAGISRQFGLKENGAVITGHLDRPAVEFLTGKWLEVFVRGLLSPFEGTVIWDLHAGVTAGQSGPGKSNEFDVSFMRNQSLCIVECKTGEQKQDRKGDAMLYKIEAIKAGLGASRVDAFLATTSPNIIDPGTGDTREALKNRSSLYNCSIIRGAALREMAKLYLANDPELTGKVEEAFKLTR
jgi:hypothetical protein